MQKLVIVGNGMPRGGGLTALHAVCPHRGGPLTDGLIDEAQVVCPLHNHAGRLVDGQCTTRKTS